MKKVMAATGMNEGQKSEAFRFMLRRATRAEHEALDAHPAFAALMDGSLSVEGYRRLMTMFHAFYDRHDRMLEQACSLHAGHRLGFTYAARSAILGDDLAALGVRRSDLSNPGLSNPGLSNPGLRDPGMRGPDRASLPAIESAGTLGGYLYVFEGSMLGGAVLCRAVEALLAQSGATGSGYWRWCRDAGAARWAMTCSAIETLAMTETARADMIAGAKAAFATFADWLDCREDLPQEPVYPPHSGARC